MGEKGAKLTDDAGQANNSLVQTLSSLGDVTSRKMFGGYGIFENGAMFALINSDGKVHLKADESTRKPYEDAGSGQHGRMPYFEVPPDILKNGDKLRKWAQVSIQIAREAKSKKK